MNFNYKVTSLNNYFTHLQRASVGVTVGRGLQTSVYMPSVGFCEANFAIAVEDVPVGYEEASPKTKRKRL